MTHDTPLSYHLSRRHFWFDIAVLTMLFVLASYIPILKIVPLVACLELFSFFSFHLLAKGRRFQLQGFLGGFISSTAVFLQVLNDQKFAGNRDEDILQTLFLAVCAMLLECLFILLFLSTDLPLIYYLPILTQLLIFGLAVVYLSLATGGIADDKKDETLQVDMQLDHPIIWKNVAKLSLIILALVWTMHFIGNNLGFSRDLSTLLVSLFEAHAILASVITEWSIDPNNIELLKLIFVILLGNTLSKSYLAYKGSNLKPKALFVSVMTGALVLSLGVTFVWYSFLQV